MTLTEELLDVLEHRSTSKNIPTEPGSILNRLSDALGQAIWLLSDDFSVVWYSDYSYKLTSNIAGFRGLNSDSIMPDILGAIKGIADIEHLSVRKSHYQYGEESLELSVVPVAKGKRAVGYIVTLGRSPEQMAHEQELFKGLLAKQEARKRAWKI